MLHLAYASLFSNNKALQGGGMALRAAVTNDCRRTSSCSIEREREALANHGRLQREGNTQPSRRLGVRLRDTGVVHIGSRGWTGAA